MTLAPPEVPGPVWLLDPAVPIGEIRAYLAQLTPEHRAKVLDWIRAQTPWRSSPLRLGRALDPTMVVTPALSMVDQAIVSLINSPPPSTGGHRGLIICMPPQEGKSTAVTQRGTEWLLVRNPDTKVGLVSYEQENMRRISFAIRTDIEYFNGEEGTLDMGLRLRRGEKAAARWNLGNGKGGIYAIGITGAFTGRPVDVLIIDDPVKDYRAADSSLISEQTWVWWLSVGRPRLAPGAPVIVVLTRWSDLDLAGRLIAEQVANEKSAARYYDRWEVINIPAQADHRPELGEIDLLGRAPGEWLLSARGRTPEQWEATKNSTLTSGGSRVWSALYQGRPAPKEGGEIKRAWFRYENTLPVEVDEWLASWDMKLKEKRSGDYVAGGLWTRTANHYHLREVMRGQWDFPTVQNAIALMLIRWPDCHRTLIENTGNGPEVMEQLRRPQPEYVVSDDVAGELGMTEQERAAVQELRRRGVDGLVPANPRGSKQARIRAYLGVLESGHVHLPVDAAWAANYVDELASFGVGGAYDDQVDMTSQALRRLVRRGADDDGKLKVAEGRVPPTAPARAPGLRLPPSSRQARIVRQQLDRRPKPPGSA